MLTVSLTPCGLRVLTMPAIGRVSAGAATEGSLIMVSHR